MRRGWGTWSERSWRDDFIVRVRRRVAGARHVWGYYVKLPPAHRFPTKYFGITKWGSLREALRQARLHRDELVKLSGEPPRRRGKRFRMAPYSVVPRADNTSGLVGVTVSSEGAYEYWLAWYAPRAGVQKKRRWSIHKYGYEGALILATEWRAKMIAQLHPAKKKGP